VLQATRVTKRFGAQVAVAALDLAVERGEVYCMLGANGAGKTTTIQLFLGFHVPEEGVVRVGERSVADDPVAARRQLAYVPEVVALYPQLTGAENLRYFFELAGGRADRAALRDALIRAGLPEAAIDARAAGYSKGMRQKVALALALARQAPALLLDEPLSGLDPVAANEFVAAVRRVADGGVAVFMATHDVSRAKQCADRVGVMRGGRLVRSYEAKSIDRDALERAYLDIAAA
jgi:ABC-2 type transport system ATP-binding protein